tara:strand:+ start:235 stop:450 length:216 start_codon:yes stop_codon:yes gene_type:complete
MLNEPDGQKESNLIFSKKIQYISIAIILFTGIMIYIVKPERFNKIKKEDIVTEEITDSLKSNNTDSTINGN